MVLKNGEYINQSPYYCVNSNFMLTLKSNNRLQKSLKKFVLKEFWMCTQLSQMVQILKKEANLQQLSLLLQEKQTVPHIFKYLILIHRLVMQETPHSQLLLRVLGKLKWFSSDRIEESMSVKLIKPFQLYLQKRVFFTICALTQGYSEDGETRVYRLINLLHFGTSFANMLYILGRYYQRQWIPEFNIGLCMDLRAIYDALTYSMPSPPTREILDEIQLLHQKLYLAFYNCYFHRYLKNFVPKWIKTDYGVVTPTKSRNKMSQKTRSQSMSTKNKSTVQSEKNIPISSSKIDLEQSNCYLFGNQSLMQSDKIELDESFLEDEQGENMERLNTSQKRTELIKDMERIVSMFAQ